MMFSVPALKQAAAATFAVALFAACARAETVSAPQWGFSVTFGCQSQLGSQTVPTAVGNIVITSYSCTVGETAYFVAISDYPAGSVTPAKVDAVYAGAINGAAANAKGSIRSVTPYALGKTTGREALIDVPTDKMAIRMRIFLVGDRMYQALFAAPAGQESGADGLKFLNSFKLAK